LRKLSKCLSLSALTCSGASFRPSAAAAMVTALFLLKSRSTGLSKSLPELVVSMVCLRPLASTRLAPPATSVLTR